MPTFSEMSTAQLATCDKRLQDLFNEVIKYADCTVLCGFRDKATQEEAFRAGTSTKHFPDSRHNVFPSIAVDVVPYPIDWHDQKRFIHFAGFVRGIATQRGYKIRSGIDWDGDFDLKDQNFFDGPHFEII